MKLVNLLQDTQEKLLNIYFCNNASLYEAKILLNISFDASEFIPAKPHSSFECQRIYSEL